MVKSIRLRLQFWYALVLIGAVSGFGIFFYHEERTSRYAEIDAELTTTANFIDVSMRSFPPNLREGTREFAPMPRPPWGEGDFREPPFDRPPPFGKDPGGKGGGNPFGREPFGRDPLRPKKSREEFLAEMAPIGWREPNTEGNRIYAIWRENGELLNTNGSDRADLPAKPERVSQEPEPYDQSRYRMACRFGPGNSVILVARNTDSLRDRLRNLAWKMAATGAAIVLIGLVGGWIATSMMFRPIRKITTTASHISAENLKERIEPEELDQELVELAKVLNATFDRLESAFTLQSRFTADASHELRTPLAVIRSHAELALSRPRTEEEYQQALRACQTAADRMTGLVDGLLLLSLADVGRLALRREAVALDRIVAETITLMTPLASSNDVTLNMEVMPTTVTGDPTALERVVSNLVANAIHYNKPGGSVTVQVVEEKDRAILRVSDTGIGIPESEKASIFKRFFRVDKARSRVTGGTGLGLAISRGVVESHGGTITFESKAGVGTTFTVTIPFENG